MSRTKYQWVVALMPLATAVLAVLTLQLQARAFDLWELGAALTGALGTLAVAFVNSARANTEDELEIKGSGR